MGCDRTAGKSAPELCNLENGFSLFSKVLLGIGDFINHPFLEEVPKTLIGMYSGGVLVGVLEGILNNVPHQTRVDLALVQLEQASRIIKHIRPVIPASHGSSSFFGQVIDGIVVCSVYPIRTKVYSVAVGQRFLEHTPTKSFSAFDNGHQQAMLYQDISAAQTGEASTDDSNMGSWTRL